MIRYICDNGELLRSSDYELREIDVEPFYEVVNCKTGKVLKWSLSKVGYVCVYLYINGKKKGCQLHRLILSTFDPIGYFDGAQVNHIDEIKTNNKISNLEWVSCKDNINHGTHNQRVSATQTNRKDTSKPVLQFTKNGVFITEYPSTAETNRQTGICRSQIRGCCNGNRKSAGGYIWKWK